MNTLNNEIATKHSPFGIRATEKHNIPLWFCIGSVARKSRISSSVKDTGPESCQSMTSEKRFMLTCFKDLNDLRERSI